MATGPERAGVPARQAAAAQSSYAELHCLSNFSFQRGASHADELFARAAELGYRALAMTDECSMAGIVRAHEAAREHGLKLIVGTELRSNTGFRLVLLAENQQGYSRICQIITRARRRSRKGGYQLLQEDLAQPLTGCLVLWLPATAALLAAQEYPPQQAEIERPPGVDDQGQALQRERPLQEQLAFIKQHWPGRCWIAVELLRHSHDQLQLQRLQALSSSSGLPLVAAGDVRMHHRHRKPLLDVLTAISHRCSVADAGFLLTPNAENRLRSLPELRRLYPPALLAASCEIAARCQFDLGQLHYQYPQTLVPRGLSAIDQLRRLTDEGAALRWPRGVAPKVKKTLEQELALIAELQFEHYFLTVHDIVRYARSIGIQCQGRGSSANSAVCYALQITEVDPEKGHLLFSRFISRARKEPPDIDVDFEHERREEVIQYIYRKYGRERAALAATVIRYRPRSAMRDVGKALGFSADQIQLLTQAWAWWDEQEALEGHLRQHGFDPDAPKVQLLIRLVGEILGFPRHLSQHVGGFVISETALHHLVPVENAAMHERSIIQWDKDDLESLGLLKVDCLALGMLTAIRKTIDLINSAPGRSTATGELSRKTIPGDCKQVYKMICKGDSLGVFQIESRAQLAMAPRLQARSFYDLVIAVAIVRPGPIQGGMVHPYLERRQHPERVEYPSDEVRKILQRTLGIPLFQEQAMELAIVAAQFSPDEADALRRGMAAWRRRGGLQPFHGRLINGMTQRGYSLEYAERIYKQIQGFADYGFPESHAASFAQLAYESAWLKCHHPAAFLAGLINSQPMGFYPPAMLIADARRAGVSVRPLNVNASAWDCTLEAGAPETAGPALRLGMRLINGLQESSAQRIVSSRGAGPFSSVQDLARRAQLCREQLELLATAGACRAMERNRHRAVWAAQGKENLPGALREHEHAEQLPALPSQSAREKMHYDLASTQISLDAHPIRFIRARLYSLGAYRASELTPELDGRTISAAGIVRFRQRPQTASGILFITLEDETGVINLIVWRQLQKQLLRPLLDSRIMHAEGQLQFKHGAVHLIVREVTDITHWLDDFPECSRDFR